MNLILQIVLSYVIVLPNVIAIMEMPLRSPLLRAVHNRMLEDQRNMNDDHSSRYFVDTSKLSSGKCDAFLQLHEDEETKEFLMNSTEKSDWIFTQIYHSMAKSVLGWFMNPTSINGLLSRGSMFVFSKEQFRQLIGKRSSWKSKALLDLGAGDGMVTRQMSDHFEEVYVTETSKPMTWRLAENGFKVLGIDEWSSGSRSFDVISCLNLLDRCERPIKLLRDMRSVVTPATGRVIVAVVIPFKPYVEFGGNDNKPLEYLHIYGNTFEEQVTMFIDNVFEPAGFEVETFSRLPYLCEGDISKSYYMLNDAVFILKPV